MSNRSSIKDAVKAVVKLDYVALATCCDNNIMSRTNLLRDRSRVYTLLKEVSAGNNLIDVEANEDIGEIEKLISDDSIDYALLHQHPEVNYSLNQDYLSELAGTRSSSVAYKDDEAENKYSDTQSETLTTEEAEETMKEVCWASMAGNKCEVSYITRRKLNYWIMFNPTDFHVFESNAMTRDVNYTAF